MQRKPSMFLVHCLVPGLPASSLDTAADQARQQLKALGLQPSHIQLLQDSKCVTLTLGFQHDDEALDFLDKRIPVTIAGEKREAVPAAAFKIWQERKSLRSLPRGTAPVLVFGLPAMESSVSGLASRLDCRPDQITLQTCNLGEYAEVQSASYQPDAEIVINGQPVLLLPKAETYPNEIKKRQLLIKAATEPPADDLLLQVASKLGSLAFVMATSEKRLSFLAIFSRPVSVPKDKVRGLKVTRPAQIFPVPRPGSTLTLDEIRRKVKTQES